MNRTAKDRPDIRVFAEIAAVNQLALNRLERAMPDGLSYAQFNVLAHFARHGGEANPAALAKTFQVTKGAITNSLQRLEAQGYIAIAGDEADGRRKRVSITPAGFEAYKTGLSAARPSMDALRARFSEADFEAALPFLESLRDWLGENR